MILYKNAFYIIEDQFFIDFPDPYLKQNNSENRPCYYCLKEDESGVFWVIPLSFKVEKCKKEIEKKKLLNKPCDYYHILEVANRESAFLIGDMFPVIDKYFKREYTISNISLKLLDNHHIIEIEKKAKKILALFRNNIKLHNKQPDILFIEKELLKMVTQEEKA